MPLPLAAMPPLPGLSPAAPAFPGMLPLPGVPPLPGRPPLPGMPPLPGLPPFVRQSVAGPFPPFSSAITPALSMMLPLLVLPKMLEDPGSIFAAMALRPALQGGQVGQIIRGALFNGGDPKYRDEMVRGMVMPTALFSQIANTLAQVRIGAAATAAPPLISDPPTQPKHATAHRHGTCMAPRGQARRRRTKISRRARERRRAGRSRRNVR